MYSFLCLNGNIFMLALAQYNGDIRLVGGAHHYEGRLEIFLDGHWGTFCGSDSSQFSMGAAEAVCKQLGFLDQNGFGSVNQIGFSAADSEMPIHIGSANCDYSFSVGELHILRCDISKEVSSDCLQSTAIGVKCLNVSLWIPSQSYEGAVRTSNDTGSFTSSGVLEVYLNKQWGNVCGSEFDEITADSACRQMGYTNAVKFEITSKVSQDIVWLDGVSCHSSTSCDCLSRCFDTPNSPVVCDNGNYIYIHCMFDLSIKEVATSGNIEVCTEPGKCEGPDTNNKHKLSPLEISMITVGSFFFLLWIGTIVFLCCMIIFRCRPSLKPLKDCYISFLKKM